MHQKTLQLRKVAVHNLKKVDVDIPHGTLTVFTGVSGSGKSSLAFDTIFVEGQRRYIESLSVYARRHLADLPRPDAESITGISPTIAIEQKTAGKNPRSTVGTMTAIYDFLRVLFAKLAIPHCPVSGERVSPQSISEMLTKIEALPQGSRIALLAPYVKGKKGQLKDELEELLRKGYTRVRLDGALVELADSIEVDGKTAHDLDVVIDRIVVKPEELARLKESLTQALDVGHGLVSVLNLEDQNELFFSQHAYSPKSGLSYPPLEAHDFSFNHPSGMCEKCQGLGYVRQFVLERILNPALSIAENGCIVAPSYQTVWYKNIYDNLARLYKFDIDTPWAKLSQEAQKVFLYGTEKKWTKIHFVHPQKGYAHNEYIQWRGVLFEAFKRYQAAQSEVYRKKVEHYMDESLCDACQGARIRAYPAHARFRSKTIAELTEMPIQKLHDFFTGVALNVTESKIAEDLVKEVKARLTFLINVGLHYLSLNRTAPTLSGGESQRVRLAAQIGSGLSEAIYVLDEPSIGLHPRDNMHLIHSLQQLRDLGNTVIVVEHDEEMILSADYIVDVGPLAGKEGGQILYSGKLAGFFDAKPSLTASYVTGRDKIQIPQQRRPKAPKQLVIEKATHHNLKAITVAIPLERFVAITGVSGSGKSSLIGDTLFPALSNFYQRSELPVGKHAGLVGKEHLSKVIAIDQSPLGRTPRSNPATYIKLLDEIRDLFAQLPESKARGFKPGRFSFNVHEGSCPKCLGMGMVKIDMDFMEDEWVTCDECKGARFDEATLSVRYKGKNMHDVLEMSVSDALVFFEAFPKIRQMLQLLVDVGLGYLAIGQSSPTLSGGEAQRIKLARELARPSTGDTLYILDEPTTGLHFADIQKLIRVLQALVDKQNSVVVIEHNMDLVKTADWVIDLGPEGGEGGGRLVAEGTPEVLAKSASPTGHALKEALKPKSYRQRLKTLKHAPVPTRAAKQIEVIGAKQNNLQSVDAAIPHGKITVCTGPSGSGKTSFAFETVYAEGQRRYTESLGNYFRQFVKQMPKAKVDSIEGLLAAISIEQKSHAGNPRSTLGTMTEIYDYLRLVFAHLGTAYCPETHEPIRSISSHYVVDRLLELPSKTRLHILAPVKLPKGDSFEELQKKLLQEGFVRIRLNGRYCELEEEIAFNPKMRNELFLVMDRLEVKGEARARLFEAVEKAAAFSAGVLIAALEERDLFFNLTFAVEKTGKSYPPITPHTFSFNTAQGMCPACLGIGVQYGATLHRLRDVLRLTPLQLVRQLWQDKSSSVATKLIKELFKTWKIDPDAPIEEMGETQLQLFFHGENEETFHKKEGLFFRWIGLNQLFAKLSRSVDSALSEKVAPYLQPHTCPVCKGSRLNPLARHVQIGKKNIADICALPIDEALQWTSGLSIKAPHLLFLQETVQQVEHRLQFLTAIGLGYLSLDRSAPTLSGGETQRIRLARQLGAGLTGCLYVLDEPTIGLHPYNNQLLNNCLRALADLGNTLLLVEHDPLTIETADQILDFGPKAGRYGGQIVARGSVSEIKRNPASLTGRYLSGKKRLTYPAQRRQAKGFLSVTKARLHNLQKIDVEIPLGCMSCLTGVSGCGKSTLVSDLIRPAAQQALAFRVPKDRIELPFAEVEGLSAFDQLAVLEQHTTSMTIRSDVATYTDLLSPLRHFFASLPEAKARGITSAQFSYNHRKGMCNNCWGLGFKNVDLQFLPPVRVPCEACHGYRLTPLSLEVKYHGKHLGKLLELSVEEALEALPAIPKLLKRLELLKRVGLGYLILKQELSSLSGGEVQRLRLSRELMKRSSGKTLYLLDEPTTGLHHEDISKLLPIFHELADKGNTLLFIEHQLDLIANCDYLIDLGPGAGSQGGRIVIEGTPEQVAKHPTSHTATFLRECLNLKPSKID